MKILLIGLGSIGQRHLRNLYKINVVPAHSASTYDLLDCNVILAEESAIKSLNKQLAN